MSPMNFVKNKKDPVPQEIKESKKLSIRFVRSLFIGFSLFLMVSGPIAFYKSMHSQQQINQAQTILTREIKKQLTQSQPTPPIDSGLSQQFLTQFLRTYITLPRDQKAFEERGKQLQEQYTSFDWMEEKNTGLERTLLSSELYQISVIDGQQVGTYRIHYDLISPVVKERIVKKMDNGKELTTKEKYTDFVSQKKQILVNIPFQALPNNTFTVTAYPYFSVEPKLTGTKELATPHDWSTYTPVSAKQEKELHTFTQTFLQKYVSASLEDMAYLMKEPETLTGDYQIEHIQSKGYTKDKQLLVVISFSLFDKETSSSHKEDMILYVKERDNTFYIEKLTHFQGGTIK
ncbi:conjugal transfer protein [Listeria monocytogenes]|nr:conjugal transfer protein [Listeria monocytogenes]